MHKFFLLGFLLSSSVFAGTPSFDNCLDGTEIIGNVVKGRIDRLPYEEVYQNAQYVLDAIPKMLPKEKWFIHDMHDAIEFDEWIDKAFHSKDSPDKVETDYLEACVDRIVYR